jgi:hypothetical protein
MSTRTRCSFCGQPALPDRDVCRAHEDVLDEGEQIAMCTRDEHCLAPADAHEPDCPVELEMRRTYGF